MASPAPETMLVPAAPRAEAAVGAAAAACDDAGASDEPAAAAEEETAAPSSDASADVSQMRQHVQALTHGRSEVVARREARLRQMEAELRSGVTSRDDPG